MAEDVSSMATAAAASVTGPDTPTNVKASKPTKESVWTLFIAMAVCSAVGLIVIAIITFYHWPESTATQRIMYLGLMGLTAQGCIPIIVISLASSRLGRVEASAGEGHISITGRD